MGLGFHPPRRSRGGGQKSWAGYARSSLHCGLFRTGVQLPPPPPPLIGDCAVVLRCRFLMAHGCFGKRRLIGDCAVVLRCRGNGCLGSRRALWVTPSSSPRRLVPPP